MRNYALFLLLIAVAAHASAQAPVATPLLPGQTYTLTLPHNGADGAPGRDGVDGKDGITPTLTLAPIIGPVTGALTQDGSAYTLSLDFSALVALVSPPQNADVKPVLFHDANGNPLLVIHSCPAGICAYSDDAGDTIFLAVKSVPVTP